jgi:hypothetical protein
MGRLESVCQEQRHRGRRCGTGTAIEASCGVECGCRREEQRRQCDTCDWHDVLSSALHSARGGGTHRGSNADFTEWGSQQRFSLCRAGYDFFDDAEFDDA